MVWLAITRILGEGVITIGPAENRSNGQIERVASIYEHVEVSYLTASVRSIWDAETHGNGVGGCSEGELHVLTLIKKISLLNFRYCLSLRTSSELDSKTSRGLSGELVKRSVRANDGSGVNSIFSFNLVIGKRGAISSGRYRSVNFNIVETTVFIRIRSNINKILINLLDNSTRKRGS